MRWGLSLCVSAICAGILVSAQEWPVIPPVPLEERFLARTDLAVTLQLKAARLTAGEPPIFTLAIRNVGTRTLRVPPGVSSDANVRLRVFDASGRELRSPISCTYRRIVYLSSVRSHLRIEPGRARVLSLDHPCGGLPPLPVGDYRFEATYWNYADAPDAYDVYETGASETWEGRITSPRVAFTVLPLNAETERSLVDRADRAASLLKLLDTPAIPQPERPPAEEESFEDDVRPDPAAVPEYVRDVIAGIEDERMREQALKGVARFGTVDDFLRLKGAFAIRNEESRWLLHDALVAMTFVSDRDDFKSAQLPYWDAWWKAHAGRTRVQWAREALQRDMLRSKLVVHDGAPSRAAEFLLANQGLSPALVRELAQHRSWLVRLAVADAVARADERSGGRLFVRELSNRYVGACAAANERLELLVRRRYRFDCIDPGQRRQAIAHWTEVVDRLETGLLPLIVSSSE